MKKNRIGIIGHFGGNKKFYDGQTVKTKTLYEELKKTGKYELMIADTYYIKTSPVKLLWQTLKCLCTCKNIIILLSGRGMSVYFPLLYYWRKIFKTNVYHDVIGGTLAKFVDEHPKWKKYLNSFNKNWVEFGSLRKDLEDRRVNNVAVIPNFNRIKKVAEVSAYKDTVYRFCTFSRVNLEKGTEDAINAIKEINEKMGNETAKLDIYGPIEDGYKQRFEQLQSEFGNDIKYCGIVDFDKSTEVLKDYYMLLFPTFHDGEGFPGTIIDAFHSGLPTIATDWRANAEIIEHTKTGIIYPRKNFPDLYSAIEWSILNKTKIDSMRKVCFETADKYLPEILIGKIVSDIETK